ncbi:MAG TPA: GNAT family N-acetyltransferase [Armatimonadota bacterium]|nr:GNAT family N-acetyltransferase [Armatimonadota bacterium]
MTRIKLRPIRIDDAEMCLRWISDPAVHAFLGLLEPARTLEQERSWIASILTDKDHQRAFVIEIEKGDPIGTCGLRAIDREDGTALFGIMIGEKGMWDRGYGTAATGALLEYAFGELDLKEVRLSCHRENRRGIRCYEKAGFRLSTYVPERVQFGRDEVRMAVRREAWLALHSGAGTTTEPVCGRRPKVGRERTEP